MFVQRIPTGQRRLVRRLLATTVAVLLIAQASAQTVGAAVHQAAPQPIGHSGGTATADDLLLPQRAASTGDFMTMVLRDVHRFWTRKLASGGRRAPTVRYFWFTKKHVRSRGCGRVTRNGAFYCPNDDTIYISQQFARKVSAGRVRGQGGTTVGDMGLAAVIAHEYAHNIQAELGIYRAHANARQVMPFELEADCMSGMWANDAYYRGTLESGDVEEAAATIAAVGDYEVNDPQHHGTPAERKAAWMLGYDTGDLAQCAGYVANV